MDPLQGGRSAAFIFGFPHNSNREHQDKLPMPRIPPQISRRVAQLADFFAQVSADLPAGRAKPVQERSFRGEVWPQIENTPLLVNLPLKNTIFQLFGGNMGYMSVKY